VNKIFINHDKLGEIITFYSYKGGTGRTMALANAAVLISRQIRRTILVVDWDLEAPGLHHYFKRGSNSISRSPGVIDLLLDYYDYMRQNPLNPRGFFEDNRILDYIQDTSVDHVKMISAGRLDETYAARVAKFGFDALFEISTDAYRILADSLAEVFPFVLIDSRTGLNDASGACTSLMPSKLIAVFTPNRQSVEGVILAARNAVTYRGQSDDERPLMIYPLASRVELAEEALSKRWRYGNDGADILGYQRQFEDLFVDLYGLQECNLTNYFNEVEIQHVPRYAYGEEIVVLREDINVRLSLARSYSNFTDYLTKISAPWNAPSIKAIVTDTIKYDVFVAGTYEHHEAMDQLTKALRENGLSVFNAISDIKLGDNVEVTMKEAIESSRHYIVVVGGEIRPWLNDDIETMFNVYEQRGARIIPAVLGDGALEIRKHPRLSKHLHLNLDREISPVQWRSLIEAIMDN